ESVQIGSSEQQSCPHTCVTADGSATQSTAACNLINSEYTGLASPTTTTTVETTTIPPEQLLHSSQEEVIESVQTVPSGQQLCPHTCVTADGSATQSATTLEVVYATAEQPEQLFPFVQENSVGDTTGAQVESV